MIDLSSVRAEAPVYSRGRRSKGDYNERLREAASKSARSILPCVLLFARILRDACFDLDFTQKRSDKIFLASACATSERRREKLSRVQNWNSASNFEYFDQSPVHRRPGRVRNSTKLVWSSWASAVRLLDVPARLNVERRNKVLRLSWRQSDGI